ncbi:MAG: thrombospondin type 3 repeat-containing protein [Planctomycetota bacterium]|jgi:hypothetical protein
MQQIILCLENTDPQNWNAELEVGGKASPDCLNAYVDNQECAVWGILRVSQIEPDAPRVKLRIASFDVQGNPLGDMDVMVDFTDSDKDGVPDVDDNCPDKPNPGQEDADEDRIGDDCDNCPKTFNPDQKDSNGNGIGNVCDPLCNLRGDTDDDCDVDGNDLGWLALNWLEGVF